jgi:predicted acetyltransferase
MSDPLRIRPADAADARAIATLWVHAFPGERTLEERLQLLESGRPWGGLETVRVAERDDGIVGVMRLLPMHQWFGGTALPMVGLAAVAVAPWARRMGVAGALCRDALRTAARDGIVGGRPAALSVLYPFRPEYYARLGWALVGAFHRYRVVPESIDVRGDGRVAPAGETDLERVAACYARAARAANGPIERSPAVWEHHLRSRHAHVLVHRAPAGGIDGYMLIAWRRRAAPDRTTLRVLELVHEGEAAYRGLIGYLAGQSDQARIIEHDALPEERFDLLLRDPRPPGHRPVRWLWAPTARLIRGPMLRILDVRAAFEPRTRWGGTADVHFALLVRDAQLPRNNGRFLIHAIRDGAGGTRVEVRPSTVRGVPEVALDIGTLARLYAGEVSLDAAVRRGLARATGDARAVAAFFEPTAPFLLLDEF